MFLGGCAIDLGISAICRRLALHRFYSLPSSSQFLKTYNVSRSPPRSILDDDDSPVDLSEDNDVVNRTRKNPTPLHRRKPPKTPTRPEYKAHREYMKRKFPEGWNPPKKLSREAMEGLRELHHLDQEKFSTPVLAEKFKISPEAVRRILKSKWQPAEERRRKLIARDNEYLTLTKLKQRVQERMEADQVLEAKTGQATGLNSKDRFTFQ
ncbi:Required for respiratory growth protein 9 mitochondrial [Marasmius crinis-equi]|uniref:Required for respiratory growth protein 9, mitochondrial n=1 Tax=Marasmius crinis-equi TaxID=585013 RepID=A0ABR3FV16_9AGAR